MQKELTKFLKLNTGVLFFTDSFSDKIAYVKIYRKVTRNSLKLTQPSVGMVRVQSLDYFTYSCGRSV